MGYAAAAAGYKLSYEERLRKVRLPTLKYSLDGLEEI